jgi:parvulin-like peptidyl-prolyl isomerase
VKELADVPEARVRHILLKSDASDDAEKKKRADSLLTVIKKDKSKFEEMVTKFSDDPGSKGTGGVYEWFDKNRMVPEFTKASFDEKVGAITIAKTSYGYHIVEVLGQRTRKERRIVTIDRLIKPSPATFNAVYKKANEFSLNNSTAETFKSGADTLGLEIKPVDDMRLEQRYIPGLSEPTTVANWVNNAEAGTVSKPLQSGESFIVVLMKRIKKDGVPELDDVREMFTKEVVKEKKAEAYTAQMEGKTDLSAVATELGLSVQTATDMAFNTNNLPGGYAEMEVVGRIFAMKDGETSPPLKGESGVYLVNMTTLTPAPEISDVTTERKSLSDRLQGRAESSLLNALKDAAGVVDERGKYH